jgi:hypothetical protein
VRGLVDRNTVLAAAIRAGLCDFGPTATWYEVAGPFLGSKAATLIADICENPSTYDATIRWLAAEAKYCRCARRQRRRRQRWGGGHFCSILGHACCVRDSHVAQHRSDNPGLPNAAYLSMVPTYPGLVGLDAIAALRISVSVGCWRFSRCCWGSPRCVVVPYNPEDPDSVKLWKLSATAAATRDARKFKKEKRDFRRTLRTRRGGPRAGR